MKLYKTYKTEFWLLVIPLFAFIIFRLLGFDGLLGQDSYEYCRYTEKIKTFYLTGVHPGGFFWPKGYPLMAGLFALVLPINISLQLVTVICLSGTAWFTNKFIKLIHPTNTNSLLFVVIALLFSPYFLRAGLIAMSDMLAAFCLVGSFYYGLSYFRKNKLSTLILCVLLAFYAVFTRYPAIVPLSILLVSLIVFWFKNIKLSHLFVLIIPAIFIGLHFYFEANGTNFIKHEFLTTWDILNSYKRSFLIVDGSLNYLFPNIIYVLFPFFYPGFFVFGAVLIFTTLKGIRYKNRPTNNQLILGLSILLYALFLVGVPFQNTRFLVLTYPLIVVLLYAPFNRLLEQFISYKKITVGFLIFIQLVFFIRAIYPSYQLNLLEKGMAKELQSFEGQTLYSFDIDIAMQGRGLDFNYKNLWVKKYSSFEKGALVLFNEEKLKVQWEGKNPMLNWNNLQHNYQLKTITSLSGGWKLYRIE